tara:strand:- start:675 stop:857 length:183 start_codon:yes stop_codon:yes gene_type:complete
MKSKEQQMHELREQIEKQETRIEDLLDIKADLTKALADNIIENTKLHQLVKELHEELKTK